MRNHLQEQEGLMSLLMDGWFADLQADTKHKTVTYFTIQKALCKQVLRISKFLSYCSFLSFRLRRALLELRCVTGKSMDLY